MTNAKAEFVSAMMRATLDTSDLHVVAERMVVEGWRPPLPDGEPTPVPYAEHERILAEEIERRDEAEEWADKLAAALAPPHVVGGHSLKNHPWRNALEWAQENRRLLPDSETEPEHADDCTGCDGPGIVPCAADRVIGDFAYRNGVPIKDLRAVTS